MSQESTVNCLEDCLLEFLQDCSHELLQYARSQGRTRIKVDDLPFALRNDPSKLGRMHYIRESLAKITEAKKMYDPNNINEKEIFGDDEADSDKKKKKKKKKKGDANVSFENLDSE